MSLKRKAVGGFAWVFSAGLLSNLGRVAVFSVLSRMMTKSDFGIYAASMVVLGISEMLAELGFGTSLLQKKEIERRHLGTAFITVMTLSAAITGVLLAAAEPLARMCNVKEVGPILTVFAPLLLIKSFSTMNYFRAARELRFRLISKIETLAYFVGFGIPAIAFGMAGLGYWGLLMAMSIQFTLTSLLYVFLAREKPVFWFDWRTFREMFNFGLGTSAASLFSFLAKQGDYFVVGRVLGPEALGVYNRAFVLMQLPVTAVITALDRVLLPVLSKVQDETAKLRRTLETSVRMVYLLYLPLAVGGALAARALILAFLGPKWTEAVTPFRLLMLGLVFRAGYKMAGSIILAQGKAGTLATLQVAYAAAVICGALIGSGYGVNGVCVGVAAALGLNFVLTNYCAARLIGLPLVVYVDGIWRALPLVILTSVTIGLALWLASTVAWSAFLQAAVALPAAVLVTSGVAYRAMDAFFPEDICGLLRNWRTLWKKPLSAAPA
jgi:O-antigen/teichoic acid export membrane protein